MTSMQIPFIKYEGIGNDFIIIERAKDSISPELAIKLCDRHTGIGADGVILTGVENTHTENSNPWMQVINSDGSIPEMCGNGLRCVVLHWANQNLFTDANQTYPVQTDAGPHGCKFSRLSESEGMVSVEMRPASLAPHDIPVQSEAPLINHTIAAHGKDLQITAVSMGNPHAVIFGNFTEVERKTLGPLIGRNSLFPEGVNVGFASFNEAQNRMDLHVFERGAGWTQACGTGACAAAVAAVETDRIPRNQSIEIQLPGGKLQITAQKKQEPVLMTGPARLVFKGEIKI